MATNAPYLNTVIAPSGGSNPLAGQGMDYQFTLSLTGSSGGKVTILLTDQLTGILTQIGDGNVTGLIPTFLFTFNQKVYLLSGSDAFFSALNLPATFNDPNAAGNGFIPLGDQTGSPEDQVAIASYQGLLAFISRRTVQTWSIDPDPLKNAKQQVLTNIGSFAKLSVQAIGDNDIYLLYDSGFRSLRPRVASNNANVIDVGTPVDQPVKETLQALTDTEKAKACGAVNPEFNAYWGYVPEPNGAIGKIYVLNSFPSSEIEAWSTYTPSYQVPITAPAANYTASVVTYTGLTIGTTYAWKPGAHEVKLVNGANTYLTQNIFVATATTAVVTGTGATVTFTGALSQTAYFVPEKFVTYNGQVYCRAGDAIYLYGGYDNQSYDACGQSGQIPYLDCDTPSDGKYFTGMDAAYEGSWQFGFSGDYNTGAFKNVYNGTLSSFQTGNIPLGGRFSTHFSLNFTEVSDNYARLSSAVVHWNPAQNKK